MEAAGQTLRIARPIDEVWRAWTDASWLAGWHAERVDGQVAAGRTIRLVWDSLGVAIELEVAAVDPPTRLVLRGAPPGRPPQTLAIDLARQGDAATSLAIRHDGFPPGPGGEEERAGSAAGWHTMARVLDHYLARHRGRPRSCAAALAPAAASLGAVEPLLARPDWLGATGRLGAEGERFTLTTPAGLELGGTVLARALPRQIALAIDDIAGVVVLRAIRLDAEPGGALLVGALAWSWQPERPAWAALLGELEPATARLCADLGGAAGGSA